MMFNRLLNNDEVDRFFEYLKRCPRLKSHYCIRENIPNESYSLYIDCSSKIYEDLIFKISDEYQDTIFS